MKIKQISVFLENKVGHLADCISFLEKNDIPKTALCLSETAEFGILHFITEYPEEASRLLQREGFAVGETEVLVIHLPDTTKTLSTLLYVLKESNVNIEYMYMGHDNQFIFRFEDLKKAIMGIEQAGFDRFI